MVDGSGKWVGVGMGTLVDGRSVNKAGEKERTVDGMGTRVNRAVGDLWRNEEDEGMMCDGVWAAKKKRVHVDLKGG